MLTYTPKSEEETMTLAKAFSKTLLKGDIVCFFGDLGAGKTTFIKGLASQFGVAEELVTSPTFQYVHIYEGSLPIFHFDLYRLSGPDDFLSHGFEEFFAKPGISCIEWAEKIETILPKTAIRISISHKDEGRSIDIDIPKDEARLER